MANKKQIAKKMRESSFGLPHGEKETPQLRKRFKNYVKHMEKKGGFGPGDRADKYRLQKQNSFYEFNKSDYDK